ncbi:MAG: class I SAM-dependent methyltransferase [Actinomycetota bacterium]|nr:class I SAM-dependent methyltransferase [Actinomycetota bacterium]
MRRVPNPLNPLIWRARLHVPNALASVGVLGYRRYGPVAASDWDRKYESGAMESDATLPQLARYGVVVSYLEHVRARRILDVGCGTGLLRRRLGRLPFERYVGADPSSAAIDRARSLEDEQTTFVVAERAEPGLGPFDAIVCNEMLYYVDDPNEFLEYATSILERGGHVVSSIWRHPRDVVLHKALDRHFDRVDAVEVAQKSAAVRPVWRVALHRRRD